MQSTRNTRCKYVCVDSMARVARVHVSSSLIWRMCAIDTGEQRCLRDQAQEFGEGDDGESASGTIVVLATTREE